MTRNYTVLLEWDEEGPGYAVTVPALPGCFSQGSTVAEAMDRAREAIAGHIAVLRETGQDVPSGEQPTFLSVVHVEDTEATLTGD